MSIQNRLQQLEQEASLNERIAKPLETNPEYLQLSIKSFLMKYSPLMKGDKLKAYEKLKVLLKDPNFKLMYSFYEYYFDTDGNEIGFSSDLNRLYSIKEFKQIERTFCDDIKGINPEGLISPEGIYYPAVKSHYILCSWFNLKGVDIRQYVRTIYGTSSKILFSDLTSYIDMDKEKDFLLTEQQIKAMQTLFRIYTKNSQFALFHDIVEESYVLGFCKFLDKDKRRKQIQLFEDVLGKKQIDSDEILSSKIKYY